MDAQSNSSKQDSSDRPSDTPNSASKPRRMSVAQKALAPFAHLRPIQQQYGPGSVEAFGALQQAEQTVQRSVSTKGQDNVTAQVQKDTPISTQTPGAPARQVPPQAEHLTRFEAEYNARRLAAAIEGPKFDSLLSQAQNQIQSCPGMSENPATVQTQNTCQLATQTSNQERQVEAQDGSSSSNLAVQHPVSTQNQNDLAAQTQKG
ncbi:hypothetical protein CAEBREN_12870 [Caenorhabditis brenneri]|uniref:Uncharacterized protein n=1 Tax=Caenorhabditis brenneri TaxID=135651 RepID=G0PGL7_CAEBE|nr:hypothetical protein CAEBREN_12870 [Caenorhabditis brenneri]